jgi:phosphoserine phosphatase RsbU/P
MEAGGFCGVTLAVLSGKLAKTIHSMDKPFRVLHLEDDRDFATLVTDLLEKEGLPAEMIFVSNYEDFISALEADAFDMILADYQLPTCNGIQALEAAREKLPHTPFLLVSGTIGEQAAIESLR